MFATCVPWYVPHGSMGLSKHGDPVFPLLPPEPERGPCSDKGGGDCCWATPRSRFGLLPASVG